ncbi:helix-turn-helix domain-containing protein [Pseudodesulfovibrio indicus]
MSNLNRRGSGNGYATAVGGFTFRSYGNHTMSDAPKILTIKEVACFLRVHRATISRLVGAGALPSIAVGSRRLVLEADLLTFIENRRSLAANSPKGK